ncbi:MAG: hypothetical protein GY696_19190 [Gammaproteobacteria bacterium]|nr:hypothetical protein [Gammaproteobacteria bacterium]
MTGTPDASAYEADDFQPRINSAQKLLNLWAEGQKKLDRFWESWHVDYLQSLRERGQMSIRQNRIRSETEPKIGQIVLITEQVKPRGSWRIARIEKVFTSESDNRIRVAEVRLPGGKFMTRPIVRLVPLELDFETLEAETEIPDPPNVDGSSVVNNNAEAIPTIASSRPKRASADRAKKNISKWTTRLLDSD